MNEHDVAGLELEPERYELREAPYRPWELDRRKFFRTLGGGLIVLSLLREAEAQEPARPRRRGPGGPLPKEIGAWLHIAEDGTVTACTGKVEVGQNARTSLTQAVAEELRLPPGSIRMVMADTAQVPFDMGTFGSRTTPTMLPQLRRASAAARGLLIGLAAERLGVERAALTVAEGKVSHPPTGRTLVFGELTRGHKLLEVIDDGVSTTPVDRLEVIGRSAPKVDGRAFVTGEHRFTSDLTRPGMMRGKVLRPSAFEAKLTSLDTAEAEVTILGDPERSRRIPHE